MASLKEIRIRLTSVQSTQKITAAMKLVSAAKLRKAQSAILSLRPYSLKLNAILGNLSSSVEVSADNHFFENREPENVLIIAITSNRGLCGAFNTNIAKEIQQLVKAKYEKQNSAGTLQIICLGKKGAEQLKKKFNVIQINEEIIDAPKFEDVAKLSDSLMLDFCQKKIDKIEIVYNRFINPATQKIEVENYLPIINSEKKNIAKNQNSNFLFEPSQKELMNELIPKILKLQLYKTILDSEASEHGARMTSMAKATDNASEILKELKLKYNNARQAAITNELNEIVSGAEALNN